MAGNQSAKDGECKMSIESKIKTALNSLGYKIYPGNYDGADETYFVFNYNTMPDDFGDNKPQHERALVQVHLFCSHEFNSVNLRNDAKEQIFNAGFTWPYMTNAGDEDGQHWVFESQIGVGVDG
jgi:hypothetical protein